MASTTKDFVAVLADLISDSPKLLSLELISQTFTPQLIPNSQPIKMLLETRPAFEVVAGPISEEGVNHGLGGLLCVASVSELGQPKNTLTWGAALNIVWWINREFGVAGFFATQQAPFGNANVTKLVNAWKRDFWSQFYAETH